MSQESERSIAAEEAYNQNGASAKGP